MGWMNKMGCQPLSGAIQARRRRGFFRSLIYEILKGPFSREALLDDPRTTLDPVEAFTTVKPISALAPRP